ncbi:MAG: LLM class flavin-dependent oxidoreductase [Thaumarchaeota archaeon]|nr:LLM class flavin-dependent oxidoreductase [Nitrososphaerota archaeon]
MNLGLGFLGERLSVAEKVSYSRIAERNGFSSAWAAEHYFHRDAIVTSAAILAGTTRLKVGTGVINPYTRHPALLAMTTATLEEMSGGRFVLGIGTSVKYWIEDQMAIPLGDPAASLLESFRIIRGMLDGNLTTFAGKRFSAKDVTMDFNARRSKAPVYLAAVGPWMLRKSAEMADGVVMSTGSTPHYIRWATPHIEAGLAKSGRKKFGVVCLVSVGLRRDAARAMRDMMPWLLTPLMRLGRGKLVLPEDSVIDEARAAWNAGDREGAFRKTPKEVLESICICGDVETCARGIEDYRGLGVTDLVLTPISFDKDLLPKLLKRLSR